MVKMTRYFSHVVVQLVTGSFQCNVEAYGKTNAYVKVKNQRGEEMIELSEDHLRDMLVACREARKAAKLTDEALPYVSREET